jgi:hypothetical protein
MKTLLPWLCAVVLAVGVAIEYSANRKQAADLARVREDNDKLRAAAEAAKAQPSGNGNDELIQLRKDHEDLLRLRNEVRLLRDEKQQLTKQAQAAAAAPQHAQSPQQLQQLQAENQQLRLQSQFILATNQLNACISNLRQIESAKQQWGTANGRPNGSLVSPQDLTPYFGTKTMPICPGGGVYTLTPIGLNPICNIAGHQIPK